MNERTEEMIRSIQPQIDAELPLLVEKISRYAAEHQGELREALFGVIRQCALKARPLMESGKKGRVCNIVVSLLASSFETGKYDLKNICWIFRSAPATLTTGSSTSFSSLFWSRPLPC